MNKTRNTLAAILLAAFAATGCAADIGDCTTDDCSAIELADYDEAPTSAIARTPRLVQLERWAYRLVQGEREVCDMRVADYFAGRIDDVRLEGCESTVVETLVEAEIVVDRKVDENKFSKNVGRGGRRPVAEATSNIGGLTVKETPWMLMGLDAVDGVDLSAEQERLIAEFEAGIGPQVEGDTSGRTFEIERHQLENGILHQ